MSTFIELGVGFNPDMAARDNVVMNGIMMGLSPREARKRYDSVIEFAELEEFQDLKLKNYSSGMHVRLAFSVAIQVDADILLIDEVLAVGDAAFQQKCFDVFNRLRDEGKTIVFVTHDMGSMKRFCHRALLLERGSMVHLGDPQEVADRYLEINFGRDPEAARAGAAGGGDGEATRARGVGRGRARRAAGGRRAGHQDHAQRPAYRSRSTSRIRQPACTCSTRSTRRRSSPAPRSSTSAAAASAPASEAVFSFSFDNVLAPGRYSPMFTLARRGSGLDVIDRFEGAFSFVVTGRARSAAGRSTRARSPCDTPRRADAMTEELPA